MQKNKKIGIIGHFGGKKIFTDGQTVKTKVIYEELNATGDYNIKCVDTYYKTHNPIKLLFNTLTCIATRKKIIVLLSKGGKQFYFPILYFANKVFGTKVYHSVIAGGLANQTKQHRNWVKYLNSFEVNWVETSRMKTDLEKLGVTNAIYMPNFKRLALLNKEDLVFNNVAPFKLCTFSRVMKEKGIEDAIEAIKTINTQSEKTVYTLDIYGPIDVGYTKDFEKLISEFPEYIKYKGVVDPKKSVEIIKDYFALLFPTRFATEGLPGTLVDAYAAGVPVISSLWMNYQDIFIENITGWGYELGNTNELVQLLKKAAEKPEEFSKMKILALKESEKYRAENVIKDIISVLE